MMNSSPLAPDSVLINGRYILMEKVGEGATSEVYHARHVLLQRDVALKFFRDEHEDTLAQTRFLAEARAIATLNHPHVLQVFDCDRTPSHELFMAMEYLPNGDLRSRLRMRAAAGQPFTLLDVITIVRSVARGLAYTHAQGIVHRDIKPSNVFFSRDDRVVIGDFGLAARPTSPEYFAARSAVAGTPAYMAPEQIQSKPIDARADIYSLGALMYHLLTGNPPYSAATINELFEKHLHAPIPDFTVGRPDLPPVAGEILARCLAKDPRDRYASMTALVADLDKLDAQSEDQEITLFVLSHQPTRSMWASHPGMMTASRLGWRWRVGQVAALILVALTVLGLSYMLFGGGMPAAEDKAAAPAVIEVAPASGDEYLIIVAAMEEEGGVSLSKLVADRLRAGPIKLTLGERLRVEVLAQALDARQVADLAARSGAKQVIWATQSPGAWTVAVTGFQRDPQAVGELQLSVTRDEQFGARLAQDAAPLVDYYARFLLMHDVVIEDNMHGLFFVGLPFTEMTEAQASLGLTPLDQTMLQTVMAINTRDYAEADRLATDALALAPNDQALYFFRWGANCLRGQFALAEREALRVGEMVGGEELPDALLVATYFLFGETEKLLAAGQSLRGSDTLTADLGLGIFYQVYLHSGAFRDTWEELVARNDTTGTRLMAEAIRGDEAALAVLIPDYLDSRSDLFYIEANRFFQSARPDNYHVAAFSVGGYQEEVAGETAMATVSYQFALRLHPDDYLLNWRMGALEAARGNIAQAFERYQAALDNAPVRFPIARFEQAQLALQNPDALPDVDGCDLLDKARKEAQTDAEFYAPLLAQIEAAAADCG